MFQPQPHIESEKKTEVALDAAVEEAIQIGRTNREELMQSADDKIIFREACNLKLPALTNVQLQSMVSNFKESNLAYKGIYLSALVQASYDAGQNIFVFSSSERLSYFLGSIKAQKERRLHVTLHGSFGHTLGGKSQHLHTINYAVTDKKYAESATNMRIDNYCIIGDEAFVGASYLDITNHATIGTMNAKWGYTGPLIRSTLATQNKKEYATWKFELSELMDGTNTINLIDQNRNIIESSKSTRE